MPKKQNELFDTEEKKPIINASVETIPVASKEQVEKVKKKRKPLSEERKAQLREQLANARKVSAEKRGKKAKLKKLEK